MEDNAFLKEQFVSFAKQRLNAIGTCAPVFAVGGLTDGAETALGRRAERMGNGV